MLPVTTEVLVTVPEIVIDKALLGVGDAVRVVPLLVVLVVTCVNKLLLLLLVVTVVLVSALEAVIDEALPVTVPVVKVLPVEVTVVTEFVEYCDVG